MTEKLKVSREVADAIEKLSRNDVSTDRWLKMHSNGEWGSAEKRPLNTLSLEEFARALIVGYEAELTPHEIIKADYENVLNHRKTTHNDYKERFFDGYLVGVEDTLATLGITIKGVNDI